MIFSLIADTEIVKIARTLLKFQITFKLQAQITVFVRTIITRQFSCKTWKHYFMKLLKLRLKFPYGLHFNPFSLDFYI